MKKSILIGITLLTLLFSTGPRKPPCSPSMGVPLVALRSPYFTSLEPDTHVPATIQGMPISCYIAPNHTLRCVVPNKFVDQYVTIKVAVDGALISFYVYVPEATRGTCARYR